MLVISVVNIEIVYFVTLPRFICWRIARNAREIWFPTERVWAQNMICLQNAMCADAICVTFRLISFLQSMSLF